MADSVSLTETNWAGLPPNGRHGATTENVRRYVDFAARHGIGPPALALLDLRLERARSRLDDLEQATGVPVTVPA